MVEAKYLEPTAILDSDHPRVVDFTSKAIGDRKDPTERAVRLHYSVRDGILYDPYSPFYLPEHYRAKQPARDGKRVLCLQGGSPCAPSAGQGGSLRGSALPR